MQRSKGLNRIFTFWEPRDHVPAYLRLCRDTWTRNSPGFDITVLDHDNLEHHTGPDALDIETLKSARLGLQKDAILFAVLAKNGGIFMDMDTIVLSSLQDIQRKLDTTELLTYHMHLGFVAARPGAELVLQCLTGVQQRLALLKAQPQPADAMRWDYLGNSIVDDVVWKAAHSMSLVSRTQGRVLGSMGQLIGGIGEFGSVAARFLLRLDQFIATQIIFRQLCRHRYTMLNRDRHRFIAERVYGDRRIPDPRQRYLDYWFETPHDSPRQPPRDVAVVGLHNSWTPHWYSSLSEDEVLAHDCLLSRTLREALSTPSAN